MSGFRETRFWTPKSPDFRENQPGETRFWASKSLVWSKLADSHPRIELPLSGLPLNEHSPRLEATLRGVPGVGAVKVNGAAGSRSSMTHKRWMWRGSWARSNSVGFQVGVANVKIGVENLRSASCVKFIEDELKSMQGVLDATVNITTQEATLDYLPQKTTLADFNKAIETWDYKPRPALSDAPVDKQEETHAREYRRLMNKFWFAAAISIPVLISAYTKLIPVLRDWPAYAHTIK